MLLFLRQKILQIAPHVLWNQGYTMHKKFHHIVNYTMHIEMSLLEGWRRTKESIVTLTTSTFSILKTLIPFSVLGFTFMQFRVGGMCPKGMPPRARATGMPPYIEFSNFPGIIFFKRKIQFLWDVWGSSMGQTHCTTHSAAPLPTLCTALLAHSLPLHFPTILHHITRACIGNWRCWGG